MALARSVPYDRAKRALDLVVGLVALVVGAPVLATAALAVRATMGRPVLFRQERAGQGGTTFLLLKFRTMRAPGPGQEGPDADDVRLTAVGRALRATSLDELPSFVNVVRGELSLVGPRPLPVRYLPRYGPEQRRRHDVKPGITGWSQVNGRNSLSWDRKFELDVWYVEHRSLALDLRILRRTVAAVVHREGVSAADHATMPEFLGGGDG